MFHQDLRQLLWGTHLHKLLVASGVEIDKREPTPRIAQPVPIWFQRSVAVLTLVGVIGGVRLLDRALSFHQVLPTRQADLSTMDVSDWSEWALRLHSRLNPFGVGGSDTTTVASTAPHLPIPSTDHSLRVMPQKNVRQPNHTFRRILATAYSNPALANAGITASCTLTTAGTIALSRDLLRTFTPDAPFDFGDKVLIPGVGVLEVRDTMNPRWTGRADLWFSSPKMAMAWGCRSVFVTRVEGSAPTIAVKAPNP